jgi:phosphomannomutase
LSFVQKIGADLAIINDGDADRVGLGDENGVFIDQLRVYGLIGYYFLEVRGERGPIVKTISTTKMLNKLANLYDVPVFETGVGFKYIAPKMVEVGAMIGGEESGGYAFRGQPSELLDWLFEKVGPHYYDRIDSRFDQDRRSAILANVSSARPRTIGGLRCTDIVTVDGHQFIMEDGGWLLIRFSGTEPIIRVYCETTRRNRVAAILDDGMKIAGLR